MMLQSITSITILGLALCAAEHCDTSGRETCSGSGYFAEGRCTGNYYMCLGGFKLPEVCPGKMKFDVTRNVCDNERDIAACNDPPRTVRSCEGHSLALSCPDSSTINILRASYGRSRGRDVCGSGPIWTTRCHSGSSDRQMRSRCQGKNSCRVPATNGVFGDPCWGTYKYLEVTYTCVRPKTDEEYDNGLLPRQETCDNHGEYFTDEKCSKTYFHCAHGAKLRFECPDDHVYNVDREACDRPWKLSSCRPSGTKDATACEDDSMTLSCPSDSTIDIVGASYGRTDHAVCSHRDMWDFECHAKSSDETVKNKCQGKSTCQITANNVLFHDPCVGTHKYLQVAYKCKAVPKKLARTCEHNHLALSCPGSKIKIYKASYGRSQGRNICNHPSIFTTRCHSGRSESVVKGKCEGRSSCSVHASNGVFGDPCWGTFKYLEVLYGCV